MTPFGWLCLPPTSGLSMVHLKRLKTNKKYNRERLLQTLEKMWGPYNLSPVNAYFNCPFCNDTRNRLGIEVFRQFGCCFNCNTKGSVTNLMIRFAKLKGDRFNDDFFLNLGVQSKEEHEVSDEIELSDIGLPFNFEFFKYPFDSRAMELHWNYLKRRGIPLRWAMDNLVGFCPNWGRVVFPMVINEDVVFWVARTIYNDVMPKTMHPSGVRRPVFWFPQTNPIRSHLRIAEGVFDAFAVDGICTLGSTVANNQVDVIAELEPRSVTICFDDDKAGREGALSLASRLQDRLKAIDIAIAWLTGNRDPFEVGRDGMEDLIMTGKNKYGEVRRYTWAEQVNILNARR